MGQLKALLNECLYESVLKSPKTLISFNFSPLLSSCRTHEASRKYYCFAYIPIFTTEGDTLISHHGASLWRAARWFFLDFISRRPPLIQTCPNKNFKIIKELPRGNNNWNTFCHIFDLNGIHDLFRVKKSYLEMIKIEHRTINRPSVTVTNTSIDCKQLIKFLLGANSGYNPGFQWIMRIRKFIMHSLCSDESTTTEI